MFVDELTLKVIAGTGGDGCTSFWREKYVSMGGPDGGNGGKGSDIIFKVDKNLKTLIDLRYLKTIKGERGEHGKGSNKYGKGRDSVYIYVPMGTVIADAETNLILCDLTMDNQEYVVAQGGRGGKGNKSFATHENPAPQFSEKGEPGEERILKIELKVLADVGLIGMPSVGKSTFLSVVSSSKPKIAAYHFTTLSPNLGLVRLQNNKTFVIADLPGLIEGASDGIGLGDKFLKHAMRTRILAHIIDMGSLEGRNPIDDYAMIRNEISKYDEKLTNKKEVIIANKMDLPNASENLKLFKEKYNDKDIFPISAINNENIDELLIYLANLLEETPQTDMFSKDEFEDYILFKFKKEKPYSITKEKNYWIITGEEIEKMVKMTKFNESEGVMRFSRKLRKMGIEEDLEKLGAQPGEEIRILNQTFIFKS